MSDRADDLARLRDVLWESIVSADPDKRASLAAQYRATLSELDELVGVSEKAGDPLDEITARRAARGVSSSGSGRSAV